MKITLLQNQIELLLDSLEFYSSYSNEKRQLVYSTYESLLAQMVDKSIKTSDSKKEILHFQKSVDTKNHYIYNRGDDRDNRFFKYSTLHKM